MKLTLLVRQFYPNQLSIYSIKRNKFSSFIFIKQLPVRIIANVVDPHKKKGYTL